MKYGSTGYTGNHGLVRLLGLYTRALVAMRSQVQLLGQQFHGKRISGSLRSGSLLELLGLTVFQTPLGPFIAPVVDHFVVHFIDPGLVNPSKRI